MTSKRCLTGTDRISEVAKELDKHNGQAETLQKELDVANDLVENFRNMRQEYENEYEDEDAYGDGDAYEDMG